MLCCNKSFNCDWETHMFLNADTEAPGCQTGLLFNVIKTVFMDRPLSCQCVVFYPSQDAAIVHSSKWREVINMEIVSITASESH